jgi:hypothetical protein
MADKQVAAGNTMAASMAQARDRLATQKPQLSLTPQQSAKFETLPTNDLTTPYAISMSRGVRNDAAASAAGTTTPSPATPNEDAAGRTTSPTATSNNQSTPSGSPQNASSTRAASASSQTVGNPQFTLMSNKLNDYVNYSYGLSLHFMSANKFNSVMADVKTYSTSDESVLIASSARSSSDFSRNQFFKDCDFSIENLRVLTVIGLNHRSRGSNAIQIEFTVLEPHGMTLIERFIKLAESQGITSWDEIPIMLQIDFFGNKTPDMPIDRIPGTTKYLPIKFINCKIAVSTRGSEYKFTAVPMSHAALLQNAVTVPTTMKVTAQTIGDFFSTDKKQDNQFANRFDPTTGAGEFGEELRRNVIVESFAAALNQYQDRLVELKEQEHADTYVFKLDSSMKQLKIQNDPLITNAANRTPINAGIQDSVKQDWVSTHLNPGTSIIEVINQVMRQSEYYKRIIQDESSGDGPIEVHKIVPEIRLGAWDNIRKTFQKTFTFYLVPYRYHNQKYPYARRSTPSRSTCVKEYFYTYTGKNDQILDFKIDYNVMFYTALTSNVDKFSQVELQGQRDDKELKERQKTTEKQREQSLRNNYGGPYTPNKYHHVSVQRDVNNNQQAHLDPDLIKSGDLFKSLMTTSAGDMLNLDLKISGDPDFIKQDDVFLNPTAAGRGQVNTMNSINMDAGEVHVNLEFRTYTDIDQEKGIMINNLERSSGFSGVYRVLQVENIFDRGQFTQNLNCVRLPNVGQESATSSNTKINPRTKTSE